MVLEEIVQPLVKWYRDNKRILPWRDKDNAYMELLVQQMEEQKKRSPKPLEKPVHKQITPILIRRNTTS